MPNPLLSIAAAAARWLPDPVKRALYRLGPASAELREALNRAAPAGLHDVQVAGGGLAGTRLVLDLQTEKDYWLGTYEMDLQKAIHELAGPGMVAFDLGANIGYISLLLAKEVGPTGQVFAFEPLPQNQERLHKNLILNPLQPVELIPMAIGESSGKREFLVHSSTGMGKLRGSAGRNVQYETQLDVECVSVDDFVFNGRHPKPDMLKIDIEGGEGEALIGMSRLLREQKPLLIIELHGQEAAEQCWDILKDAGYRVFKLERGYPPVEKWGELDRKSYILARPA